MYRRIQKKRNILTIWTIKKSLIFLIIICSCGIGYLSYVIFQSKNIDSVKLVGELQTVYIVGDEIEVTVEALDQAAAKGDYYTLVAGLLTKDAVATDATCFLCLGTHSINIGGTDVTTYVFRCVCN